MRHYMAAGTSVGRLHLLAERPNQDAYRVLVGDWGAVAAVCDGCGSEPSSGVGAALGASLAVAAAARQLSAGGTLEVERLRAEMLAALRTIAATAGLDVREAFLFTVLVAAMAGGRAFICACGDGVVAVDGGVRVLGPFPDNAPPYLAYALEDARVGFDLLYDGPARSVLIGTDGVASASLAPFWSEGRYFRNRDLVRRRLRQLRLEDDATVAVLRDASLSLIKEDEILSVHQEEG